MSSAERPDDHNRLLAMLVEDNPGSWFGPFAAAVTALRTGLVPAALRSALYKALTADPVPTTGDGPMKARLRGRAPATVIGNILARVPAPVE